MSMSKKKILKQLFTGHGKKSYFIGIFIGIVVILIVVALLVFALGYGQSSDNSSASISKMFGILDSSVSAEDKQEYINAFIAQNKDIGDRCEILHFYSHTCGACQRLEPWLLAFKAKYPEIQIVSHELTAPSSKPLFSAKQMEYGVSSVSIPAIFVCGAILVGVEPIETSLEPMALAVYNLEPRNDAQIPVLFPLEMSLT